MGKKFRSKMQVPSSLSLISSTLPGVSKKYTKLIKYNLKLTRSISTMQLFLNFTQSNLNFEPSFVGIYQLLREIWVFEHEFHTRNFGQLRIFGGIKFVNKLFIKLLNFICISKSIETGWQK